MNRVGTLICFAMLIACGGGNNDITPDAAPPAPDAAADVDAAPPASVFQALVEGGSWQQDWRELDLGCTGCRIVNKLEVGASKVVDTIYTDVAGDVSGATDGAEYCHDIFTPAEQSYADLDPTVRSVVLLTLTQSTCGNMVGSTAYLVADRQDGVMVGAFFTNMEQPYAHAQFPDAQTGFGQPAMPLVQCETADHVPGRAYCMPSCDYPGADTGRTECAFPEYVQPPYYDWSCEGAAPPTSAPDPLGIQGRITQFPPPNGGNVAGATVDVYSGGGVVGTATTAADGSYNVSATTGGSAFAPELRITEAAHVTAHVYPPYLLGANYRISFGLFTPSFRDGLATAAGVTMTPGDGFAFVRVLDCSGTAISGAQLTAPAAGSITYLDPHDTADSARTSTSATGRVMLWNLPPGDFDTTVDFTFGGHTMAARTATSFADEMTIAYRRP